ncbi:MAG: nucleotide exchange factor GrpE [Anaerolineae bacterium]
MTDKEIKMPDKDAMENEAQPGGGEAEAGQGPVSVEEIEAEELDEVGELLNALEGARDQAEEYLDGWRRTQAEFSNYKKRRRAEEDRVRELANAHLLRKLLPVMDGFERAIVTVPDGIRKLSWIQGLLMVRRELEFVLESEGVEPIDTEGEDFDPYYHEAVTHEEVPGYQEGQIIGEVQQGYVLGDRVLRPALVRVAKAPSPSFEEGQKEEPEEAVSEEAGE